MLLDEVFIPEIYSGFINSTLKNLLLHEFKSFKINNMKKFISLISSIFALFALASCSSSLYQATWQARPVIADGNPTEWSLPLRYSDSKSGLQYNITNDETNLYVCIRATERPAQMKILSSGMVIWIDPSGKNKETTGIHFPLPVRHDKRPSREGNSPIISQGKNPERMSLQKEYELEKPEISLSGFLPQYNGTFEASEAKGAQAAINWDDQDNMTYELVIPFKAFFAKDMNALKDNPVIGFTINVAAFTRPQGSGSREGGYGGAGGGPHPQGMEGGQGGMAGGQGGGHSGGMGESHQSAGGSAYSAMSEPTSIKFKIKLNGLVKK